MFESYIEQSVTAEGNPNRKKRMFFKILHIAALAIFIISIMLFFIFPFIPEGADAVSIIVSIGLQVLFAGSFLMLAIFAKKMENNLNLEFDYVLNGQKLLIIKILNRKKRKKMLEINLSSISSMGKISLESYERLAATPQIKKHNALVHFDNDDVFFAFYQSGDQKSLLHFEPNDEILRGIRVTLGKDIIAKK